ncbi:hypothetical protein DXG01_006937 [Tephrocybe rancida]|nr:hypothetical protein DXG01_006937 [Tephrocybe rancida]
MFMVSFALTSHFHHYVTPGKGEHQGSPEKERLWRNSHTSHCGAWPALYLHLAKTMFQVPAALVFLSLKYNKRLPYQWPNPSVIASLTATVVSFIAFLLVELYVAQEPMLAPAFLKQKIPVLVGISNFLVATCNFSVNYFYPMWFQTVMSTSAATAGMRAGTGLGQLFRGIG